MATRVTATPITNVARLSRADTRRDGYGQFDAASRHGEGDGLWTKAPAGSSLAGWPWRSSPPRPRTRCGSPSTGLLPWGRPRWPTNSHCSLRSRGREVIRASAESFHLPRAQRYGRGEFSPEANYHGSFDYDTLRRLLLDPLGPGGDRRYQHAVYDLDTDTAMSPPATTAPADAVLLLDGVFLPRPELTGRWDLSIFVSTALDQVLDRARIRDLARLGTSVARPSPAPNHAGNQDPRTWRRTSSGTADTSSSGNSSTSRMRQEPRTRHRVRGRSPR
jgi:hypothetical protein